MADPRTEAFAQKLGTVFQKCLAKIGPDARQELAALITPEALAIIAGVLVAWILGHLVGIGELIDIVIGVVGVLSIGLAVFSGLDELYAFAKQTYGATSDSDLDGAADHLAKAIAILGVQAVLAVLLKNAPRLTPKFKPMNVGPEPVRTPGLRYQPKTVGTSNLGAGEGATSFWGDMEYSTRGAPEEQRLVRLHEKVHQFLTPKVYLLRRFRVERHAASYVYSSLARYIEEALAETVAQVRVNGLRGLEGWKFPVENGYVYWIKPGADPRAFAGFGGKGVIPEGAALIASGMTQGVAYRLFFKADAPGPSAKPEPILAPPPLAPTSRTSAWPSFRH